MVSITEKLLKNAGNEHAQIFSESTLFDDVSLFTTKIPIVNVALSSSIRNGMKPGSLMIAGESKNFKTLFGLILIKSYLDTYPDAGVLFYDSEFGALPPYFKAVGIDTSRIVHIPITTVEELTFNLTKQLNDLNKDDRVIVFVDSIGMLSTRKEVTDIEGEKEKRDMTRAAALRALARVTTGLLNIKKVPMISINHVYKTQDLFSKTVISGGQGIYLAANDIWVVSSSQEKTSTEVTGKRFHINIEKSRSVIWKSRFDVVVDHRKGIKKYSGLFEIAEELGLVKKASKASYKKTWKEEETGFKRGKAENDPVFWKEVFEETDFEKMIENKYKYSIDIMGGVDETVEDDYVEDFDETEEEGLNQ